MGKILHKFSLISSRAGLFESCSNRSLLLYFGILDFTGKAIPESQRHCRCELRDIPFKLVALLSQEETDAIRQPIQ